MNSQAAPSTISLRLRSLYAFGVLMIIWNILGHSVLGFEQAIATVIVAVATSIFLHPLGLWLAAWTDGGLPPWRRNDSRPGWRQILDEVPAAIIPGFACGMLLYPNSRLWPIVFAVAMSFGSKTIFRAPDPRNPERTQHMFNPSNFGILATLVMLPSVGLAPPYQFTAELGSIGQITIPAGLFLAGCAVHFFWAKRWLVVLAWFVGFALQAIVRGGIGWWKALEISGGTPDYEKLLSAVAVPFWPYTGTAFMLFSFFMIPDPATTPDGRWQQVIFGVTVSAVYGVFQYFGIVYGFFWGLIITCAVRGLWLNATQLQKPPNAERGSVTA